MFFTLSTIPGFSGGRTTDSGDCGCVTARGFFARFDFFFAAIASASAYWNKFHSATFLVCLLFVFKNGHAFFFRVRFHHFFAALWTIRHLLPPQLLEQRRTYTSPLLSI